MFAGIWDEIQYLSISLTLNNLADKEEIYIVGTTECLETLFSPLT